jgi:DNA-binding NarL/FixJ family response regulator
MPLTVVLADDDVECRLLVRATLAPESDRMTIVGEAADGEQALALVLRTRPDIVISDLLMPRLTGIGLTRLIRIRQELRRTKIIIFSSHTEDAYRLMASDSGADAFVSKDVLGRDLLPAIRGIVPLR